jgi:hypothetical protein
MENKFVDPLDLALKALNAQTERRICWLTLVVSYSKEVNLKEFAHTSELIYELTRYQ